MVQMHFLIFLRAICIFARLGSSLFSRQKNSASNLSCASHNTVLYPPHNPGGSPLLTFGLHLLLFPFPHGKSGAFPEFVA